MSMLTHRVEQSLQSSGKQYSSRKRLSDSQTARIKGFYVGALATLAVGGILAGLIALKAAIFLSRLHH